MKLLACVFAAMVCIGCSTSPSISTEAKQKCSVEFADGAPAPSTADAKDGYPCKMPDGSTFLHIIASYGTCINWFQADGTTTKVWWKPGSGTVHTGTDDQLGTASNVCLSQVTSTP